MRVKSKKIFKKLLHSVKKKILCNTLSTDDFSEQIKDALKKLFLILGFYEKK